MLESELAKLHGTGETRTTDFLVGVSSDPVLAIPKMNVVGASAPNYEARTYSNGGAVVVSKQNPAEAAVNAALRPGADIVELGPYADGEYDLVTKMLNMQGSLTVNGRRQSVRKDGATCFIGQMMRRKGVSRMVTHEVDPRLKMVADEMGLELREDAALSRRLGTKSGLNSAIAEFRGLHPNTMLVPFGNNVFELEAAMLEIARLQTAGKGAYLKLDTVQEGIVAAGGEGHLSIPLGISPDEARRRILAMTGGNTNFMGVTQMQLADYRVLSLSSGQDESGRFVAYEAHEQTVDGNTADGALPIRDPFIFAEFQHFWTDVKRLYEHFAVTGDQNLNAMVLSPEDFAVACALYGEQNAARMVLVDFNYRAVSGTKNAMARLQEDTGRRMDYSQDYRSRGIRVGQPFAANPHLMFAAGNQFGLRAGSGGNFTVVNMGTFTPQAVAGEKPLKTQVIARCDDASGRIDSYEEFLRNGNAEVVARSLGMPFVHPSQVPEMNTQQYQQIVRGGMEQVINSQLSYEHAAAQPIQGNLWTRH